MYHCIERAMERYGLAMTPADVEALELSIAHRLPVAVPLGATPDGLCEQHAVRFRGQWMAAVVAGGKILTFRPRVVLRPVRKELRKHKRSLIAEGYEATPTPRQSTRRGA